MSGKKEKKTVLPAENPADVLRRFYLDKALQEEWARFIMKTLDDEALSRVYRGLGAEGVNQARRILIKSFEKLAELFEPKKKRTPKAKGV